MNFEHHHCTSFRNGDWIVYICPRCNYTLHENWRTGEVKVRNAKPSIKHVGGYFPSEYKEAFENLN